VGDPWPRKDDYSGEDYDRRDGDDDCKATVNQAPRSESEPVLVKPTRPRESAMKYDGEAKPERVVFRGSCLRRIHRAFSVMMKIGFFCDNEASSESTIRPMQVEPRKE
jgi:hypothetical protein